MLQEKVSADNFTSTQGPFNLALGGLYAFSLNGGTFSAGNTVAVEVLGEDGTTYIVAAAGPTTGTGAYSTVYLPPGQVKFLVTGTVTGCYASLTRIPLD